MLRNDWEEYQNEREKIVNVYRYDAVYGTTRFENGTRIPILLMLEKYAYAVGKRIEIKVCDKEEK